MEAPVTTSVVVFEEPQARLLNAVAVVDEAAANATAVEPINLQRAKDHLRVVSNDEDSYIQSLIVTAREMAEGRLNRTLVRRQLVATFRSWGERMVLLKPPIVSVDSVEYLDTDGALQTWADFDLMGSGLLTWGTYPALRYRADAIRVTYTAGYAPGEIPMPIIQWMLLSIGTMYENRETIINGVSSAPLADDFAKWLLQPYQVYE